MIVALAGGVGGAKLAWGLAHRLGPALTVIVNTGDDFEHLGLHVSPDLDTVMYTLAGIANRETGWGITGESWAFLGQLERYGAPTWFRLGDRDVATHVLRSEHLRRGQRLTTITEELCRDLGITARILPMTDDPVRTIVRTPAGELSFQDYFVRQQCEPVVTGFHFAGAAAASCAPEALAALASPTLTGVILCPSNPFVSIGPILAVPGLTDRLRTLQVPTVAVSPIISGTAVKGPAAKMMRELGIDVSATSVARQYQGLIDGFMLDEKDAGLSSSIEELGVEVRILPTLMRHDADRLALADAVLDFVRELQP
jgi:LPPG:FO 2-phospho-L-lactate transferase